MKRTLTIIAILAAVVGIGFAGYTLLAPKTYSVSADETIETIPVKTDTIIATVDAAARLQAKKSANLLFETPGTVAKIYVIEGARVEKGALLAELDTTDLQEAVRLAEIDLSRARAQHQKLLAPPNPNDLEAARAAVDSAQANLDSLLDGASAEDIAAAQTALESARANLERIKNGPQADQITVAAAGLKKAEIALKQAQDAYNQVAYDSRAASAQGLMLQQATIDYETAKANYNLAVQNADNADILAAETQVAQAEANLQKLLNGADAGQIAGARAQLAQAKASLQKLLDGPSAEDIAISQAAVDAAAVNLEKARRALEKARLYAPFDGTVTQINVKENEPSTIAPVAIVVSDLSAFKMDVEVDEIDINRIAPGQPVVITLDSLPDEEFSGTVDSVGVAPVASATGIVAYPVTVLIDAENAPFKIGMNVNATIETQRLENVVVIPNRAIQIDRETGKAYVDKVINDKSIERTEIVLGERSTTVSQILSGVQAGDTIAIQQSSRREQLRQAIGGGPGGN